MFGAARADDSRWKATVRPNSFRTRLLLKGRTLGRHFCAKK
jgi:hypothetical protein